MRLIWEWSVHNQESGDLPTLAATFIMWGNNSQFEKGKVKRKWESLKSETRGPVVRHVADDLGAIRFPDTSMSCPVGFMVGVWVMFASFWIQHPSNIETGLEILGNEATINAYPSFWPGEGQLFCW